MWDKRARKVARIVEMKSLGIKHFGRYETQLLLAKLGDIIRMYCKESVRGCALDLYDSEYIPVVDSCERSNVSSDS
jgi:hypothetical protein